MTGELRTIEHEAAATRDRIAGTIDELQARLSPKALVDNAFESLSSASSNAVASVRGAAAGHPLMLGAAGLAVGIALLARSRVTRARVEYGDSYAAYADYDEGYAANLADGAGSSSGARAHLDALNDRAHSTVDDNPLAVVAVGVATGALLGAIVPVSAFEGHLFEMLYARIAVAGEAAMAKAKEEFDPANLSLKGGTTGLTDRLTNSLVKVVAAAGAAAGGPVRRGSAL